MNKVLITIGPFTIYWYSFIIIAAVLLGSAIATKYSRNQNMPSTIISDMILGLVISAIIGARAYYVIFNFTEYKDYLLDIFQVWKGGLAIYGAIIGGTIYLLYYCKKKKVSFIKMLDVCSLSLLLGQAIGRWGNFFNQEAYGVVTTDTHLRSMFIPEFIIKGMYIEGAYRTPTFLYESLWCLIGVLILATIRKKSSQIVGKQISFYMIWYGIGRFFIEGMRTDSLYFGNYRISQIVSLIVAAIGAIWYITIYLKTHKKIKRTNITGEDGRI